MSLSVYHSYPFQCLNISHNSHIVGSMWILHVLNKYFVCTFKFIFVLRPIYCNLEHSGSNVNQGSHQPGWLDCPLSTSDIKTSKLWPALQAECSRNCTRVIQSGMLLALLKQQDVAKMDQSPQNVALSDQWFSWEWWDTASGIEN